MAFQAPRKKKEWWEVALGKVGDAILPGDQSDWHRQESRPAPQPVAQPRPSQTNTFTDRYVYNRPSQPVFQPPQPKPQPQPRPFTKEDDEPSFADRLNPFGEHGLFGASQQKLFASTVKPVVSKLQQAQDFVNKSDKKEGFQWNDAGDYARFAANLPASMAQGMVEAPEKVGRAVSGYRVQDGKTVKINPTQRVGEFGDAYLSTAGAAIGGSGRLIKSVAPNVKPVLPKSVTKAAGNLFKDAGKESAEETVQTFTQDLADDGKVNTNIKQYRDAAALGALGGGMMSGAGQVVSGVRAADANLKNNLTKRQLEEGFIGGKNATNFKKYQAEDKVYIGEDGLPRFKRSDAGMKIRKDFDFDLAERTAGVNHRLESLIDHSALFEEYPKARLTGVVFSNELGNAKGGYNEYTNTIYLNPKFRKEIPKILDTIVHENQHFIQGVEGFERGSSPSQERQARIEELYNQDSLLGDKLMNNLSTLDKKTRDNIWKQREQIKQELRSIHAGEQDNKFYKQYRSRPGEVEARRTATDRRLTDEQLYANGTSTLQKQFTGEKAPIVPDGRIRTHPAVVELDETVDRLQSQIDRLKAEGKSDNYHQIIQLNKSIDLALKEQERVATELAAQGMSMSVDGPDIPKLDLKAEAAKHPTVEGFLEALSDLYRDTTNTVPPELLPAEIKDLDYLHAGIGLGDEIPGVNEAIKKYTDIYNTAKQDAPKTVKIKQPEIITELFQDEIPSKEAQMIERENELRESLRRQGMSFAEIDKIFDADTINRQVETAMGEDPIKQAFDDKLPVENLSPADRAIYDALLEKDITYEQLPVEIEKARQAGQTIVDEQGNIVDTETGEIELTPQDEAMLARRERELADIKEARRRNSFLSEQQERQLEEMQTEDKMPADRVPMDQAGIFGGVPKSEASFATDAPLGKIAETFYDSKEGNQQIKYRDLEALGNTVSREIERNFKAIGSDFMTVARKVEEAHREGARLIEEVGLTPDEAELWMAVENEMGYVRRRASLGRRDISETHRGETYFPNQTTDRYQTRDSIFEGFRDNMPGNENTRTGVIDINELDFSPDVIGGYITRYGDTKLLQEERIYRALRRNNEGLDESRINQAAKEIIKLQDDINRQTVKIGAAGFGKRVTVTDGKVIDFAARMNEIGKTLGHEQQVIDATPKGLTNGDRINSVDIKFKGEIHTVGDFTGLNQHRDATAYANTHVEKATDNEMLADLVAERLNNEYRIPQDDVDYAVQSVLNMKPDLPPEVRKSRVASIYRMAAKQQLMESLQDIDIKNKTLRKDVSDLAKQILREGTTERQLSQKIVSTTLRATNALFRKLNVSSAINEMSDLTSFYAIYGKDLKIATPDFSLIQKYGLGEPDAAITPYLKQIEQGKSKRNVLKQINDGTRLYKFVEHYKAGVFLKTAEQHYQKKGLRGDELTARVLKDYREFALPVDMFTKTFLDDFPLWTQYMTWGARNIEKEGKLLTGQADAGVFQDMSRAERVARNAYMNMPAKTAFWLASNGLKGTMLMTAIGLTDFTGLTAGDYSGIEEEDKEFYDKHIARWLNLSTIGSLINTAIQDYEKERLKEKYKDKDYNPYEDDNFIDSLTTTYTPQFIKNIRGGKELNEKGYSENKAGRIQYEAPDDAWNVFKSFVFGKNQTENARDYSGRKNIGDRVSEGQNPLSAMKDMAAEQLNLKDTDYKRPLTDKYTEAYKNIGKDKLRKELDSAEAEGRANLLKGGRAFNGYLDTLKKNSPELYATYIKALDGNHVKPEYWRNVSQNAEGGTDLTTFKMIRDRKVQLKKDLGEGYDPIYDLPDDQAAQVLRYQSAPTGEDLALRSILNKEQWYKDLKDKRKVFYDNLPENDSEKEYKETERVKQWNALDDQLSSFYFDKDSKETPAWASQFPLVYQQKAINATFGFGSPESDAFFKANADAYQAQKDGFDKAQWEIINQMRKIEGYPEMSWDAYQQATAYEKTQDEKDEDKAERDAKYKNYGNRSGSGGSISPYARASFGPSTSTGVKSIKIKKSAPVKIKARNQAKKIAIKRGGRMK